MPPVPKPAPATDATNAPATETPEATFKRVAQTRTVKALDAIAAIGELTKNKRRYAWTDEDAAKILAALTTQVQGLQERFAGHVDVDTGFTL